MRYHDRREAGRLLARHLSRYEGRGHYFEAAPGAQFDLLIHLDQTRALEPLERESLWEEGEVAETYPSAL